MKRLLEIIVVCLLMFAFHSVKGWWKDYKSAQARVQTEKEKTIARLCEHPEETHEGKLACFISNKEDANFRFTLHLSKASTRKICNEAISSFSSNELLSQVAQETITPEKMAAFSSLSFSALDVAIIHGNQPAITHLLKHGADPNYMNEMGATPLMFALEVKRRNMDVDIEELLKAGADPNLYDPKNDLSAPPLASATAYGLIHEVKLLLEAGADRSKSDNGDISLLNCAILSGSKAMVRFWLNNGAKTDFKERKTGTSSAMVLAAHMPDLMEEFLRAAPHQDLNEKDAEAVSLLHYAIVGGNAQAVEMLLDRGAQLSEQETQEGATPLLLAAGYGQKEVLRRLLHLSSEDINRPDHEGNTPLHYAIVGGNAQAVEMLLDRGAQLSEQETQEGATPLLLAAAYGQKEVLRRLLRLSSEDINRPDHEGNTPLHYAAMNGQAECVQLLLEAGANQIKNNEGETPQELNDIESSVRELLQQEEGKSSSRE